MSTPSHRSRRAAQLKLFAPRPVTPGWAELPEEVRNKVENKLAKLLRQHSKHLSNGKESDNER